MFLDLLYLKITKYYFAGTQRIATLAPHCVCCSAGVRKGTILTFMVSTSSTQRLADHLGSTSLTTDSAGNVISELRYTAWGEVRTQAGTTSTSYTFTGQYSNTADFGLIFYNARWYDPALGRFAQADTIVPGGVQGYDRYAYVNNNPVNYVDPSGHDAIATFDTKGWDYFHANLNNALIGAEADAKNAQGIAEGVGGLVGYFAAGLCGPGVGVCGAVTFTVGVAAGYALSDLTPQEQYRNELELFIGKIDEWVKKMNLDEFSSDLPFALTFADGVDKDGYFYQVYIDGEWIDISPSVYKTLEQTFSDPYVEDRKHGGYYEFDGDENRQSIKEIQ